ncbi:MAG: hypothetical protein EOP45_14895 [Sphingobacteriaceae bacterium]|nr:MAG: hypothetical protein EOP45_14895 [Sphingobacteriaceae bacterium]
MSLERKFSFLYSEIIEDENDMIGHIAYSLYKSNKITYIKQFNEDNGGKNPTEADLETFYKSSRKKLHRLLHYYLSSLRCE